MGPVQVGLQTEWLIYLVLIPLHLCQQCNPHTREIRTLLEQAISHSKRAIDQVPTSTFPNYEERNNENGSFYVSTARHAHCFESNP